MTEHPSPADAVRRAAELLGGLAGLAEAIKLKGNSPRAVVWAWVDRNRVPPDQAPLIERATVGAVDCSSLCPHVRWHRVPDSAWPHPEGRPLIDVAAPRVAAVHQPASGDLARAA